MEQVVIGCAQVKMHLPQSLDELERNLLRFMRMAQTKRVRLLVFPQFAGLMTAVPLIRGLRPSLLKQADRARRGNVSFWARTRARLAGSAASVLRADFSRALEAVLLSQPEALWKSYNELFSRLARRYGLTIVAGTAYLADPVDGAVRHMALVFGPDGELLGQQAAVTLAADEHPLVEEGRQWQPIQTPAGRLGILIGQDLFYPEAGRLLAYAGVEVLIGLGASVYPVQYRRQQQGLLARVEENQLYGALCFVIGHNPFTPGDERPFVGRSLIAAPISMTPRYNGVLVEMGTDAAEGLITAEWSFPALHDLWERDETPLRATMPVRTLGATLSAIYARGLTIEQATRIGELVEGPPGLPEPWPPVTEEEIAAEEAGEPGVEEAPEEFEPRPPSAEEAAAEPTLAAETLPGEPEPPETFEAEAEEKVEGLAEAEMEAAVAGQAEQTESDREPPTGIEEGAWEMPQALPPLEAAATGQVEPEVVEEIENAEEAAGDIPTPEEEEPPQENGDESPEYQQDGESNQSGRRHWP